MLLEFQVLRPSSLREVAAVVVVAIEGWIFAFGLFGPTALVFGGVAGVLLQSLARKYRPIKVAILPAAMLGLVLGSAVLAGTFFVARFWLREDSRYRFTRAVVLFARRRPDGHNLRASLAVAVSRNTWRGPNSSVVVEKSRLRVLTLDESRGDSRQAKSPVFDSYGLLLSNKFGMGSWSEDGDNVQGDARAKNLSLKGVLYRFSE